MLASCSARPASHSNAARRLRQLRHDRKGVTTLEFAITFPMFILLVIGIIEFAWAMWMQNSLQFAVEQASRCAAIVTTTCGSASTTQAYAASHVYGVPNVTSDQFTATMVTTCGTGVAGVKVAGTLPFTFLAPNLLTTLSGTTLAVNITATSCHPT